VLEDARVFVDLAGALAGASLTVAFSGRLDGGAPASDVREVAAEAAELAEPDQAAFVFGPESSGLSREEIALCGRRARIPAHPAQPSLNLSHAAMIAAYEVYRARRRAGIGPTAPRDTRREGAHARAAAGGSARGRRPAPRAVGRLLRGVARALPAHGPDAARGQARRAHGAQAGGPALSDEATPFADVRSEEAGGFSIPSLKWRELLFVGALRADGDVFVRDPSRPLPRFRDPGLFPEGARFQATPAGGRVHLRRLP
jgi:hypothetical protein